MANTILYKLGLDSTSFASGLKNAENALKRAEKQVGDIGKNLSTYITAPLSALATVSVMAWDKQAKAMAQVEQGLKTTGNAAGFVADELAAMASDLQSKTLFGDEAILKDATAQLITFTNIAGDQFKRAQVAALDLATRLDGDLKGAAIMVGKALNDPIRGLTAMRRVGVSFTADQEKLIRSLMETGKQLEAQKVILSELEHQYGGSAEAAVIGAGKITQLKNAVGDLMEEFGRIVVEAITPFVNKIQNVVKGFMSLDEGTKRVIVTVAALAAAVGPVLFAISKLIALAKVLTIGLASISSGGIAVLIMGLVAAGAAILKFHNQHKALNDSVSKINQSLITEKTNLDYLFTAARNSAVGTRTRSEAIKQINEKYGKYLENLLTEKSSLDEIAKAQNTATQKLLANIAVRSSEQEIEAAQLRFLESRKRIMNDILNDVGSKMGKTITPVAFAEIEDIIERLKKATTDSEFKNIAGAFAKQYRAASSEVGTYSKNLEQFIELLSLENERDRIISDITAFRDAYIKKFDFSDEIVKTVEAGNKEIAKALADTPKNLPAPEPPVEMFKNPWLPPDLWQNVATDVTQYNQSKQEQNQSKNPTLEFDKLNERVRAFSEASEKVKGIAVNMSETVQQSMVNMFSSFGESLGALIAGTGNFDSLFKNILDITLQFVGDFGKLLVGAGVAALAFKQLALNPIAAIAAGTALIVISAAIRGLLAKGPSESSSAVITPGIQSIPKLAGGGIAYKPTLAMVGDNVNARTDPEVIAPVSKLKQILRIPTYDNKLQKHISNITSSMFQPISNIFVTNNNAETTTQSPKSNILSKILNSFTLSLPALATGGVAYSPTLSLVGDNRNARTDPEVIAPVSKLRDMIGFNNQPLPQRIELVASGDSLKAVLDFRDRRLNSLR